MSHRTYRKFCRDHILREKAPWEVARNAFEIALEFALLGSIKEATQLWTLFESFSSHCKSSWIPGLYFAWEASGFWPDSIPLEDRRPEALRKLEIERVLWKRSTHGTDEEGLDTLIAVATEHGRTDSWGNAQVRPHDLKAAIDLAAYMGKTEKVADILQVFADNFEQTWVNLSRSRYVWQYLKDGALARAIRVDDTKLKKFQIEVFETFKERLEKGPRRTFKDLPMRDLLNMCNENTLKNAVWEEMDVDPENPPETILHEGATEEEIAGLEKKLGHSLPADYKEFLSLTNGMESLWNGFYGEPKLWGTNDVHFTDATKQQKAMHDASANIGFYMSMSVKPDWGPMDHVIEVNDGSEESKFVWLVLPEDIKSSAERFFVTLSGLPKDEQAHVTKMLGHMYAGVEDASQLEWIICVWSPETLELTPYHSWREYLEFLAGETANEDLLDEEDDEGRLLHSQDIVAYQLR